MIFEELDLNTRFVIRDTWGRVQLCAGATYQKVAKWHAREVERVGGRWRLRHDTKDVRMSAAHPVEELKE